MIHVARDGAKLGEFSLEQIQAGLTTGQFRPTDLGWQSGMTDWQPLSELASASASTAAPVVAAPAVPATGLPWENYQQIGLVKAWFDTVSLLITKPGQAFSMMRPEGGMMNPLAFALIGGCIGSILSLVFQALLSSIPGFGGDSNDLFRAIGVGPAVFFIVAAVVSPVLLTIVLFLGSGVLHLCLMMVGAANRSFETTFRVACFSCGAANLFSIIPMCGGYVAAIYQIVLNILGLSHAHPTTTGKAVLAVFLPTIICCAALILFVGILGGFGAFSSFMRH